MTAPAATAPAWKPAVLDAAGMLAAGRLLAANRAPYYRAALMRLVPERAEGLGTVGVTERGRLLWDPAAIMRWSKQSSGAAKIGGAMAHEVLHILLNHAARGRAVGALSPEQREAWNLAGDCAINVILRAGGWELPDGAIYPDTSYGLPLDLTAEGYYAALLKQGKGQPKQGGAQGGQKGAPKPGAGQGTPDPNGAPEGASAGQEQGAPGSSPSVGGGWCGSCAGRPLPGEPAEGSEPRPGDATDAELESIRRVVAAEVQKAAKQAGKIPAELARWAEEQLAPPRVSWQARLDRATRNGIAIRSGVQDYTRQKPSRRQWGIGVGVGRPIVPAMFARKPRVAFAIDTSGSMGSDEIRTAASEVQGVLRALGHPIEFFACDAKVHAAKKVARIEDMVGAVIGGGGTDFRPVFAALARQRFEGVLVFATDGYGPAPEEPPAGIHVIWLLVGPVVQEPATWGTCIRVD